MKIKELNNYFKQEVKKFKNGKLETQDFRIKLSEQNNYIIMFKNYKINLTQLHNKYKD